jgi:hypothetical protein
MPAADENSGSFQYNLSRGGSIQVPFFARRDGLEVGDAPLYPGVGDDRFVLFPPRETLHQYSDPGVSTTHCLNERIG